MYIFFLPPQQVDSLRKGVSSDKRPVLDLLAVEGWRALLGLLDGQVSSVLFIFLLLPKITTEKKKGRKEKKFSGKLSK